MTLAWIFALDEGRTTETGAVPGRKKRSSESTQNVIALAPDHPDHSLVERIRLGDKAAFEQVYTTYFESLCDFVVICLRRTDVPGDIVNDVFANVWVNRDTWSPEKGIGPYLRGAVHNRLRNFVRNAVRAERRADQWVLGQPTEVSGPEGALEIRESAAHIWRAVDQLPESRKLVVMLRWQQQLGFSEIAAHLGVSEGAVRVQLSRALAQLRTLLADGER